MWHQHETIVTLSEETHQYHDQYGYEYLSVSALFKHFHAPFDPDGRILAATARKNGLTVAKQKEVWDNKKYTATDRGTLIHNCLEHFWRTGSSLDPMYEPLCQAIYKHYAVMHYKGWTVEQRLFFTNVHLAGTCDLGMERDYKVEGKPVIDIFDYKQNKDGIKFYDPYKKYYYAPIDHLEQCNYNEYALKLSLYALMAEKTFNVKVGRLGLIYIPPNDPEAWFEIPVPYMKREVIMMVNHYINAIISVQQEG